MSFKYFSAELSLAGLEKAKMDKTSAWATWPPQPQHARHSEAKLHGESQDKGKQFFIHS